LYNHLLLLSEMMAVKDFPDSTEKKAAVPCRMAANLFKRKSGIQLE
jgi:hypothetical protein